MFNFNNIDFSTLKAKVVKIERPLIAPQKISSTNIEGRAAEVFHRKVSSSYNVDVEFYLFSSTGMTLISDIRTLAGMLDTEAPAKLIFNDEPDKYLMAIVEETEIEKKGRYAIIKVSFKILDPYSYAVTDDVYTYTTAGSKSITRKGNAESYPLITIEGLNSAGYIEIGNNGSTMRFSGSLLATQKLVIDSNLLTAYILKTDGTKVSVLNKLDKLDFPILGKGANTFKIAVSGATLTSCTMTCNSRWK